MNKKYNYVKCNHCAHWDNENRRKLLCDQCNNTCEVIDPKQILCNRCGERQRPFGTVNDQYPQGLENIKVTGGYDSFHLFDMTSYIFSICEKCLRELFNQFKIKPEIIEIMRDDDSEQDLWAQDQDAYEYRIWEKDGGFHNAYVNGKCNFKKDCPNNAKYTQLISDSFTERCCCEEHKDLFNYMNSKLTKFIPQVLKPFL
jgi:hypothetical protein